jgi:predicted O-methyltransferase YrrM
MTTSIHDFAEDYHEGFNKLFPIEKYEMANYYKEDPYSGYPKELGGSVWESEGKALYTMIRVVKPKNVLEIGNLKGCSANHILKAVQMNGGEVDVTLLDLYENLDYDKIHPFHFHRILQDSVEFLNKKLLYDFYMIDGEHSYEHTKKELELIIANTKVSCYIWAHDYFVDHDPSCQVKRTWDEMADKFSKIAYLKDKVSNCGFVIAKFEV